QHKLIREGHSTTLWHDFKVVAEWYGKKDKLFTPVSNAFERFCTLCMFSGSIQELVRCFSFAGWKQPVGKFVFHPTLLRPDVVGLPGWDVEKFPRFWEVVECLKNRNMTTEISPLFFESSDEDARDDR